MKKVISTYAKKKQRYSDYEELMQEKTEAGGYDVTQEEKLQDPAKNLQKRLKSSASRFFLAARHN